MTFLKLSQEDKVEDAADLVDFSGQLLLGITMTCEIKSGIWDIWCPFLVDGSVLAVDKAPLLLLLLSFICKVSCFCSIFCFVSVNSIQSSI